MFIKHLLMTILNFRFFTDYTIAAGQEGTIVIPSGLLQECIELEVLNDALPERNESITFTLINTTVGAIGDPNSATIRIVDDEGTCMCMFVSVQYTL